MACLHQHQCQLVLEQLAKEKAPLTPPEKMKESNYIPPKPRKAKSLLLLGTFISQADWQIIFFDKVATVLQQYETLSASKYTQRIYQSTFPCQGQGSWLTKKELLTFLA